MIYKILVNIFIKDKLYFYLMKFFKNLSLEEVIDVNIFHINNEIDDIIQKKNKPIRRIEDLLDTLLEYMNFGKGENEFKRLNSYYETFNPEDAKIYEKFYSETEED